MVWKVLSFDVFKHLVKAQLPNLLGGEVFSAEGEAQAASPVAKVFSMSLWRRWTGGTQNDFVSPVRKIFNMPSSMARDGLAEHLQRICKFECDELFFLRQMKRGGFLGKIIMKSVINLVSAIFMKHLVELQIIDGEYLNYVREKLRAASNEEIQWVEWTCTWSQILERPALTLICAPKLSWPILASFANKARGEQIVLLGNHPTSLGLPELEYPFTMEELLGLIPLVDRKRSLQSASKNTHISYAPIFKQTMPLDFTRFRRQISASSSKLLECHRAQLV